MRGGQAVEWQSRRVGMASRMTDGEPKADAAKLEKAEQAGWHIRWVLDLTCRNTSEKAKANTLQEQNTRSLLLECRGR